MNHIAHCLLSYADDDLLVGNFIGDFVKGRSWERYSPGVQRGILLHRAIDRYTDTHHATRESIRRIRPFAGRYSPPLVDILYDHLLCRQWSVCSPTPFEQFAGWVYTCLDRRSGEFPLELSKRWPQMLQGRFLEGYRQPEGLKWVLLQFNKRLDGSVEMEGLVPFFFEEIDRFTADFQGFFPDLLEFVRQQRGGH